jgi:radical SAM superfamily enzyme
MVEVQVAVAPRPDELPDAEVALLRDHVREQRVGCDIERHAEEDVGAALVHLARQLPSTT